MAALFVGIAPVSTITTARFVAGQAALCAQNGVDVADTSFVEKDVSFQAIRSSRSSFSGASFLSARGQSSQRRGIVLDVKMQQVQEQAPPKTNGVGMLRLSLPTLDMRQRPRRNRKSPAIRSMFRETTIGPENFIYPLFIHDDPQDVAISAMPGCSRLSKDGMLREVEGALSEGVKSVVLFPKVLESLKTSDGRQAYVDDDIVPRSVALLKKTFGRDLVVITDIALDPYSADGHDGIVDRSTCRILNDETVEALTKQALCHARAGADIVSPSDMMDGRVGAIRDALDDNGFTDVSILSYTAKYASAYYGPFRVALDSDPRVSEGVPEDKSTYQMDPANYREALIEAQLDEAEGADMLMVKPGGPYLDVIRLLRDNSNLPIAAYQVSGEYAMIKAACQNGWLDERKVVMESLIALRRAGADFILTYFARQAARYILEARQ